MERRNLKSHTLRVHAGKSPSEEPSAGQRTLSFSVASGNDNEGEKRARLDDEERERSDPKIVGDKDIDFVLNFFDFKKSSEIEGNHFGMY